MQLLGRGLQFGVDRVGGGQQELAGFGEGDPAGAAVHQRGAGPAFERGDLLGDRRGGVAQLGGGPGEAARAGDFTQDGQPVRIDQQFS